MHTTYISEVKRNLCLPMYDVPNAVEKLKKPRELKCISKSFSSLSNFWVHIKHPTVEMTEAIKEALKHFEIIE